MVVYGSIKLKKSPSPDVWDDIICLGCRMGSPFVSAIRYDPKEACKHTSNRLFHLKRQEMAIFWFWYSRILPCGTNHIITKWWKPLKNATFHTFDGCKKFWVGCLVPVLLSKVALHPRELPEKIWVNTTKLRPGNLKKASPPRKLDFWSPSL